MSQESAYVSFSTEGDSLPVSCVGCIMTKAWAVRGGGDEGCGDVNVSVVEIRRVLILAAAREAQTKHDEAVYYVTIILCGSLDLHRHRAFEQWPHGDQGRNGGSTICPVKVHHSPSLPRTTILQWRTTVG